jgi:hypothetical protein
MHTLAKISLVMSAMVSVFPAGASGGGVVTECTEAALRAAMAGWGSVTFACDGTITVSNTVAVAANTTLDAMGHRVTLSGGQTVGVLYVNSGATLTLLGLTIANGYSTKGSAIYNAGTVDASSCLFLSNSAAGMAGPTGMHGYNQITFGGNAGDGGPGGDGKGGGALQFR